ncbi:unnamed protein product [Pleuronectes platessa]|uniref:Uncharacterized protein n=1 Tax=Pleuronectes platessa TaxID=8262 RepID=A0A9N7VNR5_PLEPL|nr:unnamed protein product [Pleuronectes platessa]
MKKRVLPVSLSFWPETEPVARETSHLHAGRWLSHINPVASCDVSCSLTVTWLHHQLVCMGQCSCCDNEITETISLLPLAAESPHFDESRDGFGALRQLAVDHDRTGKLADGRHSQFNRRKLGLRVDRPPSPAASHPGSQRV